MDTLDNTQPDHAQDWLQFTDGETPSSLALDPIFFEYVNPEDKILDYGSAWGRVPSQLREQGYNDVVGFDINVSELALARKQAHEANQESQYVAADARNLPFAPGTFNACLINGFMASQVDPADRVKVLKGAREMLKDDGILYMGVFGQTPENDRHLRRYEAHEKLTGEYGTYIVTDTHEVDGEELYRCHHYSEEELRELLEEAGFEIIELHKKQVDTISSVANGYYIIAKPAAAYN